MTTPSARTTAPPPSSEQRHLAVLALKLLDLCLFSQSRMPSMWLTSDHQVGTAAILPLGTFRVLRPLFAAFPNLALNAFSASCRGHFHCRCTYLWEPLSCSRSPLSVSTLDFSLVVNWRTTVTSLSQPRFVSFLYESWIKKSYLAQTHRKAGIWALAGENIGMEGPMIPLIWRLTGPMVA